MSRNIDGVSGLFHLQQSLAIGSYAKMLVRIVLSDRYRRTQEKFQYQEADAVSGLYPLSNINVTFYHYNLTFILSWCCFSSVTGLENATSTGENWSVQRNVPRSKNYIFKWRNQKLLQGFNSWTYRDHTICWNRPSYLRGEFASYSVLFKILKRVFSYSWLPLSRTGTGNENLFDIEGVRDIRTQCYCNKPYRKARANGNLFEVASCSR